MTVDGRRVRDRRPEVHRPQRRPAVPVHRGDLVPDPLRRGRRRSDYYYDELTKDGGEESACGWVKDKFGVSWQVIPDGAIPELVTDPGPRGAPPRATAAMMKMKKLDVGALEQAAGAPGLTENTRGAHDLHRDRPGGACLRDAGPAVRGEPREPRARRELHQGVLAAAGGLRRVARAQRHDQGAGWTCAATSSRRWSARSPLALELLRARSRVGPCSTSSWTARASCGRSSSDHHEAGLGPVDSAADGPRGQGRARRDHSITEADIDRLRCAPASDNLTRRSSTSFCSRRSALLASATWRGLGVQTGAAVLGAAGPGRAGEALTVGRPIAGHEPGTT